MATFGAMTLIGVLVAMSEAPAARFTWKGDNEFGAYREKPYRKSGSEGGSAKHQTRSRGDANRERHHGRAYGAYEDDYGGLYHGRASHPHKSGDDADPGDGRIRPHRADQGLPDGNDRRAASKQSADSEHNAERRKSSKQGREADRNDDRRGQHKKSREADRWGGGARWAKAKQRQAAHVSRAPFGDIPAGPLQIVISINQQKLHLYSDGMHVADAPIATGVPAHPTPTGVFSVIDKERYHASNIYSGAPMPYMQRITWSGVALHQGQNLGHPASHGCIRMSQEFASRLWILRSLGARVIIARPELIPQAFADPHLFVHMDKPPAPVPVAGSTNATEGVKTAETVDNSTTTDVTVPSLAPDRMLRGTIDTATNQTTDAKDAVLMVKPVEPVAAATQGGNAAVPEIVRRDSADSRQVDGTTAPLVEPPLHVVPLPAAKPSELVRGATGAPLTVFVSRKTSKLYVRRQFAPLFDAPVVIAHPERPLGTHVFTAMEYLADGSTFRWNLISLPGESPARGRDDDRPQAHFGKARQRQQRAFKPAPVLDPPPPETPHEALARIEIPQGVIERISELMVAGSSLIVSDHDLGDETGQGTDFIVVTR